jgi:hypothetical protein
MDDFLLKKLVEAWKEITNNNLHSESKGEWFTSDQELSNAC